MILLITVINSVVLLIDILPKVTSGSKSSPSNKLYGKSPSPWAVDQPLPP